MKVLMTLALVLVAAACVQAVGHYSSVRTQKDYVEWMTKATEVQKRGFLQDLVSGICQGSSVAISAVCGILNWTPSGTEGFLCSIAGSAYSACVTAIQVARQICSGGVNNVTDAVCQQLISAVGK